MTLPPLLLRTALSETDAKVLSDWAADAADAITKLRSERDALCRDIEQADKASAQLECMYNVCCDERAALRSERDNAIAECVMHIGNAKALRDRLKWFEDAGGVAMATRIHQVIAERDALAARIAYLDPIFIAASNLVDNAEEYECDGLGLWAQHGWWEPLHDALDPDGSATADDIRQPVAPAK